MSLKRADCISNLNYLFIHAVERETKQQHNKSQAAENCNELWKKLTKMGNLITYQQITSVERLMEMCKERSNFNCTDSFWGISGLTLLTCHCEELSSLKVNCEKTLQTPNSRILNIPCCYTQCLYAALLITVHISTPSLRRGFIMIQDNFFIVRTISPGMW